MADPAAPAATLRDVSIPMERAAQLATRIVPVILLLGLLPHFLAWGWPSLRDGLVTVFTPWYFIPGVVATVIVHEALHAVGFLLFGRVPRESVHFGLHRATMSPYAGCRVPMSARAYRGAVLLPALVLGAIPLLYGWATGIGWITVLGTLQLFGAAGDMVAFAAFRDAPAHARVIDHPEQVGCRIVDG